LRYWKLAGTWLEEERAEYQLSRSRLRVGDTGAAMASIDRCIDICTRNGAPPFEMFFGYAVKAVVHRAKGESTEFAANRRIALEQYERIPDSDRQWCARERDEIGG
jgi:hypothetical protein